MRVYLGDGCYVEMVDGSVVLTTSNGIEDTNRIVLDPEVYEALERFVGATVARHLGGET